MLTKQRRQYILDVLKRDGQVIAKTLADEVRWASRGHMPLLHLILGTWLVASGWQLAARGPAQLLSILVGLALLAWAVYGGWSSWREWRSSQSATFTEDDDEYVEADYEEEEEARDEVL